MKNKEVYKVIGEAFKKSSLVILGINMLISLFEIVSAHQSYLEAGNRKMITFELPYLGIIIFLFIMGANYCFRNYGGWLSIRADRRSFLNGILIVGVVGSLFIMGISYILIWIIAQLQVYLTQPIVGSRAFSFKVEYLISISSMAILCFALGACVGAIFYRLRPLVATCLVSIPLITLMIIVLSQFVFENKISEILLSVLIVLLQAFLNVEGQVIYTIILWLITYSLLIHAPMERYKYDLL
ncbi:MAG: hypothetical protein H9872_03000 [Candidatus Cellulosilyticum pullistercoris]|uniref:Uncharacterized protein n=1 Tax=Candidatus Cellulosilyticum pullistercoris TaxID=2838521 RepID=A0A9E2KB96_9FIRM|nr:hypothetical protein [Candidatus Cellulosilyticum pullistercoris]